VKLIPGLPWQNSIEQEEDSFHQRAGYKFKVQTSEILRLEYSFVWYWN